MNKIYVDECIIFERIAKDTLHDRMIKQEISFQNLIIIFELLEIFMGHGHLISQE